MITRETLKGCRMEMIIHYDGRGFFGDRFQCIEHPRLQRDNRYEKKTRTVTTKWLVDGIELPDLDQAIAALNIPVVMTEADRAALQHVPVEYEDIRRREQPGHAALGQLRSKGLIEWHQGKCRRTAAANVLLT